MTLLVERSGVGGSGDPDGVSRAGTTGSGGVLARPGALDTGTRPALARSVRGRGRARRPTRLRTAGPLVLILLVQTLLTFKPGHFASQQEAVSLLTGHLEWARLTSGAVAPINILPGHSPYLAATGSLYPFLAGISSALGGLAGARALSLVFMLGATALVCGFTRRLFGDLAGVVAACLFMAASPTLFLGDLAVYDAMAVFFLALGARLAVTSLTRRGLGAAAAPGLAGAAAALCALTGAEGVFFAPVIGVIVVLATVRRAAEPSDQPATADLVSLADRVRAGLSVADRTLGAVWRALAFLTGTGVVLAVVLGVLPLLGQPARLPWTSIASGSVQPSAFAALGHTLWYIGPAVALAVLAHALLVSERAPARTIALASVLLAGGVLGTFYSIRLGAGDALVQLDAFSLVFAAPLAAEGARHFFTWWRGKAVIPVLAGLLAVLSFAGATFSTNFDWKSDSGLVAELSSLVSNGNEHYLLAQPIVPQYYLASTTQPREFVSTVSFQYLRPGTDTTLSGPGAYRAAIYAGYFSVIALPTGSADQPLDGVLRGYIETSGKYHLIAVVPLTAKQAGWDVWAPEPGVGQSPTGAGHGVVTEATTHP